MDISDIKIRKTYTGGDLRALVSATIGGDFVVHEMKLIEGPERYFVGMPSRVDEFGIFHDVAHPITPEAREILEKSVLKAYFEHLEKERESETAETESRVIDD